MIYPTKLLQAPSDLPTVYPPKRKSPTTRNYHPHEYEKFLDKSPNFEHLNQSHAPKDFSCNKQEKIVYYSLDFDNDTGFPSVLESIKDDRSLHVQLQYNRSSVPLLSSLLLLLLLHIINLFRFGFDILYNIYNIEAVKND